MAMPSPARHGGAGAAGQAWRRDGAGRDVRGGSRQAGGDIWRARRRAARKAPGQVHGRVRWGRVCGRGRRGRHIEGAGRPPRQAVLFAPARPVFWELTMKIRPEAQNGVYLAACMPNGQHRLLGIVDSGASNSHVTAETREHARSRAHRKATNVHVHTWNAPQGRQAHCLQGLARAWHKVRKRDCL